VYGVSWSTTLKNRQQIRAYVEAGQEIALMFSDIRGFTSYTARKGDRAAFELSQLHESLLREQIEEQGGIIVKTMGDGIMAAFASLSPALYTSVGIQQTVRQRNGERPVEPIDIGIGLASGTPIMTDADFIGHSVNLSQRVSSMAKGGQILVTERFAHEVTPPDRCHYISLGKRELKGLDNVQLYEVAWMSEVARLSDRDDTFTLILTEKGTLVVELAKNIQAHLDDAVAQLGKAGGDGAFSSFLQRGIEKFTRAIVDKSLAVAGIAREQLLDKVDIEIDGKDVSVSIGGHRHIRLQGVDVDQAALFRDKMLQVRESVRRGTSDGSGSGG
jgi:class 3 adenylate cyclase